MAKRILVNQKFKPGSTQILLFRSCVKMMKVYLVVHSCPFVSPGDIVVIISLRCTVEFLKHRKL